MKWIDFVLYKCENEKKKKAKYLNLKEKNYKRWNWSQYFERVTTSMGKGKEICVTIKMLIDPVQFKWKIFKKRKNSRK